MAFVPGYQYDIFVSYARVDDEPPPGRDEGWVTMLIANLQWRLRQLSGRRDEPSIWMDHALARNERFGDQIADTLQHSATFLAIVSPAYLESDWCRRECKTYVSSAQGSLRCRTGMLLVEREPTDPARRPQALTEILGHQFWKARERRDPRILGYPSPNPDTDRDYFSKIDDIAREAYRTLCAFKSAGIAPPLVLEPSDARLATVFLAQVPNNLEHLRDDVKRTLEQFQVPVLPKEAYPRSLADYQRALASDIEPSSLFVQLLSDSPDRSFVDASQDKVLLQYRQALSAKKKVLHWASPSLDVAAVADPDLRSLLGSSTVHFVSLEDFKRDLLQASKLLGMAHNPSAREAARREQIFVFINISREDVPLAEKLCNVLEEQGYSYALPAHDCTSSEEVRKDLEANLLECDGLLLVYGRITEMWVREQLRMFRRMIYRRGEPLRGLAIFHGPPPEKPPIGMKLPNMQIIDCRDALHADKLQRFLQSLEV